MKVHRIFDDFTLYRRLPSCNATIACRLQIAISSYRSAVPGVPRAAFLVPCARSQPSCQQVRFVSRSCAVNTPLEPELRIAHHAYACKQVHVSARLQGAVYTASARKLSIWPCLCHSVLCFYAVEVNSL